MFSIHSAYLTVYTVHPPMNFQYFVEPSLLSLIQVATMPISNINHSHGGYQCNIGYHELSSPFYNP